VKYLKPIQLASGTVYWAPADTDDDGDFALANDPPPHIPAQFDNQTACAQRKLISGLDCLPGQGDLFDA
jgi:hypothetical protein